MVNAPTSLELVSSCYDGNASAMWGQLVAKFIALLGKHFWWDQRAGFSCR